MFASIRQSRLGRAVPIVLGILFFCLLVVGVPVGIRSFLFQPFNIPAGSMKPTVLIGDFIFVSKFRYGFTHYSLPYSPNWFSGRIFGSEPQRGDVVVFRTPKDTRVDFVKRVIGSPGDRIQMINGLLHINGQPVKRERIADFIDIEDGRRITAKRWRLTLPNDISYEALDLVENGFLDNTQVYNVPAGHYFMMGDNLDNSTDSRILSQIGYVPFENLIGRVEFVFFSIDQSPNPAVRWDRVGKIVR